MPRCPVCEKELTWGPVCGGCGFDASCDYESRRTLCSALPRGAEPISVRAARRRPQQPPQQSMIAVSPANLVCSQCGGRQFWLQTDVLQVMCTNCGAKMPLTAQKDGPVTDAGSPVEKKPAEPPKAPPMDVSVPPEPPVTAPASPEPPPASPGPPPATADGGKGSDRKGLYLYEKAVLVLCLPVIAFYILWIILLFATQEFPDDDAYVGAVAIWLGSMLVPFLLSCAVRKDRVRKNECALSTRLRVIMNAVFYTMAAVGVLGLVLGAMSGEDEYAFFGGFCFCLGIIMFPLTYRMTQHRIRERKLRGEI